MLAHWRIPPLRGGFRVRMRRFLRRDAEWEGYPAWLNPEFELRACVRERWREAEDEFAGLHAFQPRAYALLHRDFWGTVFDDQEPDWTGTTLEVRAPLLDVRLSRFLLRVPPVPLGLDKELNRRAMRKFLPDAIVERPKTPVTGDPLQEFLKQGKWQPEPIDGCRMRGSRLLLCGSAPHFA